MRGRIGSALATARRRAGLSQEDAAEAIGISRVLLSYYERGTRQPPFGTVVRLARLYGAPLSSFLEAVVEEAALELEHGRETCAEMLYRAAPPQLGGRARAGMQRYLELVEAYAELLEEVTGRLPGLGQSPFPHRPYRASPSVAKRLATELREALGVGSGPIDDLFRVVDEHVLVFRLPLGRDLAEAPSGFFHNDARVGFTIVVNSEMTFGRQLFTLAHELAHAFFHSHDRRTIVSMPHAPAERERFADLFAGQFLIPSDALARAVDRLEAWEELSDPVVLVHLQRHFGASYAALLVRLRQDGYLSQEAYERLGAISPSALARQLGYAVHPADLGDYRVPPLSRLPDRFLRLVRVAVERGIVTRGDAADTLGVSVEEIHKLMRPDAASQGDEEALRDLAEAARLRSGRAAAGAG